MTEEALFQRRYVRLQQLTDKLYSKFVQAGHLKKKTYAQASGLERAEVSKHVAVRISKWHELVLKHLRRGC